MQTSRSPHRVPDRPPDGPAAAAPAPYGPEPAIPLLDAARLRAAVAAADIRVLLMVLIHLSGDRKWLSPPFRPRRDVRLIADEDAGLPPAVQAEVRAAAVDLLTARAGTRPAIADPGDDLMLEMMRVCMGEAIAPGYAPMMREELGFVPRDAAFARPPQAARLAAMTVLIVGAGASGIILGARLKRLGIAVTIVERAAEVGGTWRDNTYPGCGVDTPNHAYSFSLGGRYRWPSYFSARDDLYAYLRSAADAFGIRSRIEFGTEVVAARWDDGQRRWRVSLSTPGGRREVEASVLVSAIGQFGLPAIPAIAGADSFRGPLFHTTAWPDDLDLEGKRVAVIGTGASAMQIVPAIAGEVSHLDVYQRSPQWIRPIPRYHDTLSDDAQWLLGHVPFYAAWFRFAMLWRYGDGLLPFLRKDPDWGDPDRSLNLANDRHRQEMTDHIRRELAGRPDLIAPCIPAYPPYGKRILLDNGWYRTLRRPNVDLVSDPIARITPGGIVTGDGQLRPADVIVMSTGFRMTEMTARLNVSGRGGADLRDAWGDDNATGHLGITVPGFPNLFIMQGPNTGLGHGGSAICQAESQARYISGAVAAMIDDGIAAVDVRQDVHDAFVARVDALHEQLIWTHPGMSTYYRNAHGRVVSVTPFSLLEYWQMTHDFNLADFHRVPSRQTLRED